MLAEVSKLIMKIIKGYIFIEKILSTYVGVKLRASSLQFAVCSLQFAAFVAVGSAGWRRQWRASCPCYYLRSDRRRAGRSVNKIS